MITKPTSLEQKIAAEIPNAVALMAKERADGTFGSLHRFYERHRPLPPLPPLPARPPGYQAATLADAQTQIRDLENALTALTGTMERRASDLAAAKLPPQLAALTQRAVAAETALAQAQARVTEMESAERSSDLGRQLSARTAELDQARGETAAVGKKMRLLEGLSRVRGVSSADAPPALAEPVTPANYEARYESARTPAERAAIITEMEAAHLAGRTTK